MTEASIFFETLLTGAATLLGVATLLLLIALADAALGRAWRRWQYTRYLRSDAWQAKRLIALSAASYRCARCGGRNRLEVHHKHYRTFQRERPQDLEVVCRTCHKAADAERKRRVTA
jgi:DNA-directed RNA polymerase subunit RPC12/RpoP